MSNDNEIGKTCFYVFFPFVNIFTNDMIKTPIFLLIPPQETLKSNMSS